MRKILPMMLLAILSATALTQAQQPEVDPEPIYVTGSVVNPRAIYSKEPLTLTQAIKLAGGVTSDAKTSRVAIYRQRETAEGRPWKGALWIAFNLQAIRKHRADDPILQPYDIVDVRSKRKQEGHGCDFCPLGQQMAKWPLRVVQ